jgi:hypothetical protein
VIFRNPRNALLNVHKGLGGLRPRQASFILRPKSLASFLTGGELPPWVRHLFVFMLVCLYEYVSRLTAHARPQCQSRLAPLTSRSVPWLPEWAAMNLNEEAAEWVRVGTIVAIWVVVLYFNRTPRTIGWAAIEQLPAVISIYAIVSYVFTHWLWRWHFLQGWLVPLPDIRGTWQGQIHSTWRDSNGQELPPIPAVLVIKQTFLSINCALHTRDSDSYSTAAQINRDDSGTLRLTFNYMNHPRAILRDSIPIHDGAAILRIVGHGRHLSLEGEYWTNRHTAGDMRLHFCSRAILDDFPDVIPLALSRKTLFPVTAKPKCKCEELEQLRREATFAGLRTRRPDRFGQLGAAELQKEAERTIDALIQHLLVGHNGKPCPAGDRPIVKPTGRR